jgi:AraC-like DNA-binding protein
MTICDKLMRLSTDPEDTRMRAEKFVESYFQAWNDHDPSGIAGHLTADGIYRDVPEDSQRSPDELVVTLGEFFANFHHHYELIGEIHRVENSLAFQYRICPSEKQMSQSPPFSYRGAEFMTLDGDLAKSITDYYDLPQKKKANKYAKSGLTSNQLDAHKRRLDRAMKTEKAFMRPDLTLPVLAAEVGCSVNHLSQVINSGFGSSFFDYLNHHRIEHAKTLLTEPDGQNAAILEIAFEVGFNSNSAFYAAFKKFAGQTPARYRRRFGVKVKRQNRNSGV